MDYAELPSILQDDTFHYEITTFPDGSIDMQYHIMDDNSEYGEWSSDDRRIYRIRIPNTSIIMSILQHAMNQKSARWIDMHSYLRNLDV